MECIILAGGAGTRLASIVSDKPKCMADVQGKPFLQHLIEYLELQGVQHVILSLGYKYEQVIDWLKGKAFLCKVSWVIEKEQLGTGGGVKLALQKAKYKKVLILNGDTLYKVPLKEIYESQLSEHHTAILALKPMQNFERYGVVEMNDNNTITAFLEKKATADGLINGGVYLINRLKENFDEYPSKFSFEKDFLEKVVAKQQLAGMIFDQYFIDIGIPEDYAQIQKDILKENS